VQNFVMSMIAKKPEDRPASTAIVARAATALRRGDVAAAIAAVPAIGAGVDAATQLLTSAGATAATTKLLPQQAVAAEEEKPKKKRSPWTWPLIALIVLLIIVLGGTLWAIFGPRGDSGEATGSPSTPVSSPSTPTPTETPVNVDALGLTGMSCDEAATALDEAGLESTTTDGSPAASEDKQGWVQSYEPQANVDPGTTVTLTCYTAPTAVTTTPGAAAITGSGDNGQVIEGGTATVRIPDFTCPTGTGILSGYSFTATNGQFVNGSNSGNTSTLTTGTSPGDLALTVTGTEGQDLKVVYTATCSGSSGDLSSPESTQSATIGPAAVVETPEPPADTATPPADGEGLGQGDDGGEGDSGSAGE